MKTIALALAFIATIGGGVAYYNHATKEEPIKGKRPAKPIVETNLNASPDNVVAPTVNENINAGNYREFIGSTWTLANSSVSSTVTIMDIDISAGRIYTGRSYILGMDQYNFEQIAKDYRGSARSWSIADFTSRFDITAKR